MSKKHRRMYKSDVLHRLQLSLRAVDAIFDSLTHDIRGADHADHSVVAAHLEAQGEDLRVVEDLIKQAREKMKEVNL